jgi:hypothetical protein
MKNLKSILGAIAPTLATAMGGPLGGMAMKMVADKLGLPDATPEAVDAAVAAATPEQLAEIKKVEADFKVQMKALDVDLVKIAAADRDSARQRHAAMKDATPTVLAIGTLLAFFGYIGAVTFLAPDADLGLINVAVGWLGGSASAVISYYFGASAPAEGSGAITPDSAEGVLIIGGDFFHADDNRSETPGHKHKLDVDSRHWRVLDLGVALIAEVIDTLAHKHAQLTVRVLRGNHDEHSHAILTFALAQRYRNTAHITVDKDPRDIFMKQWGRCLIAAHHGDKARAERMNRDG